MQWLPPKSGIVKLNFDGVSRGNPGKSGLGACVRDSKGIVLAISSSSLPDGTNNWQA